eukprot:3422436-Rhodomonas_salina.1
MHGIHTTTTHPRRLYLCANSADRGDNKRLRAREATSVSDIAQRTRSTVGGGYLANVQRQHARHEQW